ncbi:MAG: ABC transporter permease [Nitrospirota bacterium]|nr:ABC transporter permease [Nitrospirota bacterium]
MHTVAFAFRAVTAHRMRSALTAGGIAVGVATVMLLTSIGEGIQKFVISEFTQFGTHLIQVTPGRTETMGVPGGILSTTRPLTLDDTLALARVPNVVATVPGVFGTGRVSWGARGRNTYVNGVDHHMPEVWQFKVAAGRFLPADDPRQARPYAVLGAKLKRELFGTGNALGESVQVGGYRFRVIGVMATKGQILGFDMDDGIYIPAHRALSIFGREGLMEVDVLYRAGADEQKVVEAVHHVLTTRHGAEDFTVLTQKQMLAVLGRILEVLTLAVGALGAISLLVGTVGIVTIMTIAVQERVPEVGLLRALGASRERILLLFLAEAVVLSVSGGVAGLLVGTLVAQGLGLVVPALPVAVPWNYALGALLVCVVIGLLAGVAPARRAAALDPVEALRAE